MNRFWSKVDKHGPRAGRLGRCWLWTAGRMARGYGRFFLDGRVEQAHRVAWILDTGVSVPDGKHVLHRCDNPPCVRRSHLFLGTQADNMRDCVVKGRHGMIRKTHCPSRHPYSRSNTRLGADGNRICRICRSDIERRSRQRRAA